MTDQSTPEASPSLPATRGETAGSIIDNGLLQGGKVMSLFEHLTELRVRLIRALGGVFALFFLFMFTSNEIMLVLKEPLIDALPNGTAALHFTGPMDVMFTNLKVSFLAAIIFGCPLWIYQFWKFFEPALYPKERKYILPFVTMSVVLFFSGILFCYFIMLPIALKFLMQLGMEVAAPIITVTDYISLLTLLFFGFGFVFETPLVLVLLGMLEIISAKMLSENRRVISFVLILVAMLLTPPDPISWAIMFAPMYLMFEASIVIIRRMEKNRLKEKSAASVKTPV